MVDIFARVEVELNSRDEQAFGLHENGKTPNISNKLLNLKTFGCFV